METKINIMYHTLSVLIPAYNEQTTIYELLGKVVAVSLVNNMKMEIVVVNDCSKDNTMCEIERFQKDHPEVDMKVLVHEINQGKGAAIRTAIGAATGDICIIQDADLEYDPQDYNLLLPFIQSGKYKVVYGSRFLNDSTKHSYFSFYLGGRIVSIFSNLLYHQHLTDEPTCYKMFDAKLLKTIKLDCTGFEFCPEITAKVCRYGEKIIEVPINYYPRSFDEGKKIKWYDGVEAIWTLLKYKFQPVKRFVK